MRILKRQKGLPFLLALGTLFLLSASFLAVQIWSETGRGIVSALEAPAMLPPTFAAKKLAVEQVKAADVIYDDASNKVDEPVVNDSNLEKAISVKKEAKDANVLPNKIKQNNVELVVVALPENIAVKQTEKSEIVVVKPAAVKKISEKKVVRKSVVKEVKPTNKNVAKLIVKASKPIVKVSKPTPSKHSNYSKNIVRSKKKVRYAVAAKKAVDYGEIPPEWNWFNKPLKLNVSSEGVSITSDLAKTNEPVAKSHKLFVPKKYVEAPAAVVIPSPAPAVVVPQQFKVEHPKVTFVPKPFAKALARMQKRRSERAEEARKLGIFLPSMGGKIVSKSLRGVLSKIDLIKIVSQQTKTATNHIDLIEVAPLPSVNVASSAIEEASEAVNVGAETQKPVSDNYHWTAKKKGGSFYNGSGSSFSNRIQYLIKTGAWLKDKN